MQNLCDALLATGIAVDSIRSTVQESPGRGSRVSWPVRPDLDTGKLFFGDFFSVENYIAWLGARQYSAVLFDGSLLQFTFDFRAGELTGHRLAYIPCPFDIGQEGAELLRSEPILDVIEMYRGRGEEYLRLRTPIRFDFDPAAASADHPASHITLNGQGCRIPACGPLSLGQFVDFVFCRFYPDVWMAHPFLFHTQLDRLPRVILESHEQSIHLNWRGGRTQADPYDL